MHAEVGLQMERESDNEGRLSLTSLGFEDDQKLRLIDISQEDDDLLSDSPFLEDLRLSATYDERGGCNFLESLPTLRVEHVVEKLLQKEKELSPSLALVPESPCHARKSLAWDTAFFTNAGILDNDELTFINEGFKTAEMQRAACEDVRTKIFEPGHSTKGVAVSTASRKLNTSVQNKTCKSTSERASRSSQRSVQNKAERLSKRGEPHWLSLKAPKVSSPMINLLTGKGRNASIDAYHSKKANRAATMRSVHSLQLRKKSALENPCRLLPGSPSPELVSPVFPRSNKGSTISSFSQGTKAESSSTKFPSALLKRKTHSERRNFSISTSISDATLKYLEKDPESGHPKCSTQSLSLLNCSCLSSSATSSVGSCSGPRSMAKYQSREMEVYPDTSVTLTRTINSENQVIESPYLLNDLQRKSTPFSPLKEVASSLVEPTYQSTPDTFRVPTESRRKLKPSYLRLPSPKIGFFDEKKSVMSTMLGSIQLQFETQCTSPSRSGPTNGQTPNKHPRAGTSTETKSQKFGSRNAQLQNPGQDIKAGHSRSEVKLKRYSPKVWSTMKARSEVDFGFQSGNCGEVGEWICSKCRKTGAGELDRKKVGRISVLRRDDEKRVKGGLRRSRLSREMKGRKDDTTIPRGLATPVKKEQYKANNLQLGNQDETRMLANFEDRVNDLSKYFEAIDLSKDMATEDEDEKDYYDGTGNHVKAYADTTFSSFIGENVTDNQKVHKIFANHRPSLSATKLSPSSRTPLAEKTSISKKSGSLKQIAKEKLPDESSMHGGSDKENSFPYSA